MFFQQGGDLVLPKWFKDACKQAGIQVEVCSSSQEMLNKEYYIKLRDHYKPDEIKKVFILESPPEGGNYFYDKNGRVTEPLFSEMMKLLDIKPKTKQNGLQAFKDKGVFLVDATYIPVNGMKQSARNAQILKDYPNLVADLNSLGCQENPRIKIVLVKTNICDLLETPLTVDGFNVLNRCSVRVPFPSTGQQLNFRSRMQEIFKYHGITCP